MKIEKVKLKNIGPHRDLEVLFNTGLIGLVGANGAGKSTLINSIYAAMTNDFSRFSATKAEIISNNCGEEESFIEVVAKHRGRSFNIRRSLRPNKSTLQIDDSTTFTKSSEVDAEIAGNLGISKAVIDKYVFVDQWQMFQFLSDTASERAKTFQYLCGTESAMTIHKACSDFVSNHKNTDIVDNSLELQEALDLAQKRIDSYEKELAAAKKAIVPQALIDKANQDIEDWSEYVCNYKHASDAGYLEDLESNFERLEKYKEELDSLKKSLDLHRKSWQGFLSDPIYGQFIEGHEYWISSLKKTYKLRKELKKLRSALGNKDLEQTINLLEGVKLAFWQITNDKDALKRKIVELGATECPTCGSPFDNTSALQAARESLIKAKAAHAKAEDRLKAATNDAKLCEKAIDLRKEIAALGKTMPDGWKQIKVSSFLSFVEQSAVVKKAMAEAESYVNNQEKLIQTVSESVELIKSDFETFKALKSRNPSKEKSEIAMSLIENHVIAQDSIRSLGGKISEAQENYKHYARLLSDLKDKLAARLKIRDLLNTVSRVGEIFHWNNLPKSVSQANLELLVVDINDNLSMFNNPFYVEADEELTFRVFFPGKSPVKAKQLSGGQKVILSIAFRAALDRVFGHDVGMMFLDEPTAGLDTDNVLYFHDALQQMATKVQGDRQMVVITHVQELNGVFDQLIQI